jgi:hypothetical protein
MIALACSRNTSASCRNQSSLFIWQVNGLMQVLQGKRNSTPSHCVFVARISDSQIVPILRVLVRKLPGHNRHLWQAVNEFLHQLSKKSEINMMTPQNIGIVIGPNVLWQPPLCMPMMEMNTVVMNLVIYCNEVWAPVRTPHVEVHQLIISQQGPEDDPMSASGPITPRTPSRKNSVIVSPGRPAAATIAGGQGVAAAALAAALSARRGPPAAAATHHHHHHGEHPHAASSSSIITRTPSAAMMAAYDAPGSRDDSQISSDSAKSPRPLVSPRQAPNTRTSYHDPIPGSPPTPNVTQSLRRGM